MKKKSENKVKNPPRDPVPSLQESIISRVNPNKTVSIVNLELDDTCYSLDGIAADAWVLIDGQNSLNHIKTKLVRKHQPPIDKFNHDFEKLIKTLKKENLITFN
jgi:hypothetical protein